MDRKEIWRGWDGLSYLLAARLREIRPDVTIQVKEGYFWDIIRISAKSAKQAFDAMRSMSDIITEYPIFAGITLRGNSALVEFTVQTAKPAQKIYIEQD